MGKHAEWRKIAKKLRRTRIRQARAKERDQKLLEEQQKLESSPQYQKWLKQQEIMQQEREEEEARQATQREEQWLKVEEEAQRQWQELQKKIALAREEKMKQNMKIKLEWEKEEKRLKEIQEVKEKELEEKRILQAKHEKELLDFLEQGGDTPEHLKTTMETNPGKQACPFFHKVSACRFFDSCSRNHVRPGISNTILISNFFSDISLETKENEHGSDSNLEFEKEDTYEHYKEFFYDVVLELEKCGKIRNMRTCCNHEAHLRGNVYVEYSTTREALVSYHKFNGRWYAGKQLNVEFCRIESWKNAICGLFHRNRCPKGNACNFLHVFKNPRNLYSTNESDRERHSSHMKRKNSDRSSHRRRNEDIDSWDNESSERRNWRWSESPERILRNDNSDKAYESVENGNHSSVRKHRHDEKYRRDGESSRRSRRKRSTRSRSRSVSSRNRASGSSRYRKSKKLRNAFRSPKRRKRRSKTPDGRSPDTPIYRRYRSSSEGSVGSTPGSDSR